jgi:phosphatidyl-myo-inositol dimannoside synthase
MNSIAPSRQPRVLLLVYHWNRQGGLESTTVEIGRAFRQLGWAVEVVAVHDAHTQIVDAIPATGLCPIGRLQRTLHYRGQWRRRVNMLLRHRAPDADLVVFGHAGLLDGVDLGLISVPVWLWTYGIEVWGETARPVADQLQQLQLIVAISDFTAEHVRQWSGSVPVAVVPCFVDEAVFTPARSTSSVRRSEVLICGRMSKEERYKGHEILFQAVAEVESLSGVRVTVSIIGDGDDRARLERLAGELGLTDRVHFRGRVPLSELVDAYRHCGAFVMPSRVESRAGRGWTGEGFGIVYIEAAACGRPVVASCEGGARETVKDGVTGLLVDPRSSDAVAKAIARIIADPAGADAMGRAGRAMVERQFCRARFVSDVEQLLLRTVGSGEDDSGAGPLTSQRWRTSGAPESRAKET